MVDIRPLRKSVDANELEKICSDSATEMGYIITLTTSEHGSRRGKLSKPIFRNHFSIPMMYIGFHGDSSAFYMNYGLHLRLLDFGFYGFAGKKTADKYVKIISEKISHPKN